jgi:plastocyanin
MNLFTPLSDGTARLEQVQFLEVDMQSKIMVWGGAVILGLSTILAACNSTSTGGTPGEGGTVACTVTITNELGLFAYTPKTCDIKAGQKVSIVSTGFHPLIGVKNKGGPIDETKTTIPADPSVTSVTVTFPTAGSFNFHCDNHSSMVGTVNVTN